MATWTDLCYVRQTVCEEISEDFYELCGREITDYFQDKESEEISINTIFAYCLGIILRGEMLSCFDYKGHFRIFMNSFFDAYVIVYWRINMALFGSHWNEDDRLPQGRGKRQENNVYDDYRDYDFSDYFNVDTNSEEYKQMRDKIQQIMLNNLRPKMHWVEDTSSHVFPVKYYCSNCGNDELYKTPFCPQCGAMEVKDD